MSKYVIEVYGGKDCEWFECIFADSMVSAKRIAKTQKKIYKNIPGLFVCIKKVKKGT